MTNNLKKVMALAVLVTPLLCVPAQAEDGEIEFNLEQQLHQLLQLNKDTMQRISPAITELQVCMADQKRLLAEEFSINNLLHARQACSPLINKIVSKLGFTTQEKQDEAASTLYKELIKNSI